MKLSVGTNQRFFKTLSVEVYKIRLEERLSSNILENRPTMIARARARNQEFCDKYILCLDGEFIEMGNNQITSRKKVFVKFGTQKIITPLLIEKEIPIEIARVEHAEYFV